MTLDEAIKDSETISEECQRVVDTGIVFGDVTIDMIYCDNAEEELAQYQKTAKNYRQLAEWLKDYKRLLEQEPKIGRWIMPVQDDGMSEPIYYQVRCSKCGFDLDPQTWHQELHQHDADKYCPNCGSYNGGDGNDT